MNSSLDTWYIKSLVVSFKVREIGIDLGSTIDILNVYADKAMNVDEMSQGIHIEWGDQLARKKLILGEDTVKNPVKN